MKNALLSWPLAATLLLSGCATVTPTTPPVPTSAQIIIPTQPVLPTQPLPDQATQPPAQATSLPPAATTQPQPTQAAQPTANPTSAPTTQSSITTSSSTVDVSSGKYLDDRSSAVALMASLYNAINRKEYLRAFSYWEPTGQMKGTSYSSYSAGFANTKAVQLVVGQASGDAGAGNLYYTLPVGLTVQNNDGTSQKFAGCYVLHLANPGVQGTLPFQSLGIQKGAAKQLQSNQDPAGQLGSICTTLQFTTGQALPEQSPDPADISANRYLDDRSDAVQVLRSLFNAINRHEYLRAYSYWELTAAKQQLGSLDVYSNGFASTQSVKLTTGTVADSAGAGQVYHNVPITLVETTTSGATQTFVGCYTLHLSNPLIQGTPPFQPLAVSNAKIQKVDNSANTTTLMASACK
jgi:hypothetical protein